MNDTARALTTHPARPPARALSRSPWRVIAAWWLGAPTLARLILITLWAKTGTPGATFAGALTGLALGAIQDAVIASQSLIVWGAARWLLRKLNPAHGERAALWVLGALGAVYSAWLLVDVLLFINIDLRMDSSFWHFFLDVGSFWDSAVEGGGRLFLVALLALFGLLGWGLRRFSGDLQRLRLRPLPLIAAAACLSVAGAAGALWGPGEVMYVCNNVVLNDQILGARELLGYEDDLLEAAAAADGEALWTPDFPEERATWVDRARWPLLRTTHSFTGPTLFDLRLEEGERPHVLLVVMESFRGVDVGVLGGPHPVTPRFDALAAQGVLFTSFYASGIQTTRAVVSLLFGVPSRFSSGSVQADTHPPGLIGLPALLKRRGYATGYLHNGELGFERMGEFMRAHGFDDVRGHLDLLALNPDASQFSWGVHDEHLMGFVLDWLQARDSEGVPAFITTFTISNHHPWELPPSLTPIDLPVPADSTHGKFLRAMHYSDAALGSLIDGLRARGLSERTIVIITADTSQAMGDRYENFSVSRNMYQENAFIPLLILADGRITPITIDAPGGQADLLPTVLDLLHIPDAQHASLGHSLRRALPDRDALFHSPFGLGYVGLREGRWKYWYALRSHTPHLYDLSADPGERHNLADALPDLSARLHLRLARLHRLTHTLYQQDRIAPKETK
jgi:hypothetical protein